MLWSSLSFLFNPPPVFSSFPFFSALSLPPHPHPNFTCSLIHSLSTWSLQPAAVRSLSSSHLSSFLILLFCFISSLKCPCPFICALPPQPPPSLSTHLPPASFSLSRQTTKLSHQGRQDNGAPRLSSATPHPNPTTSKRTNRKRKWSSQSRPCIHGDFAARWPSDCHDHSRGAPS